MNVVSLVRYGEKFFIRGIGEHLILQYSMKRLQKESTCQWKKPDF